MTQSFGMGVVGLGYAGARHARALESGRVDLARLAAVCDVDPARAAGFSAKAYASFDEFLDHPDLHALLIATPHPSHAPLCVEALGRGLSVLVEKPFGVHKAECERVLQAHVAAAARSKASSSAMRPPLLGVVHDYRVEPRFVWLKQLLTQGDLGCVVRFNWQATDFFRTQAYFATSTWRGHYASEGGGALVNQAPHVLDTIVWLFGRPTRVWASCGFGRFHQIEVEDDVTAVLEYEDGVRGVIQLSTGESPGTQRLDVSLDGGRVVLEAGEALVHKNSERSSVYLMREAGGRPAAQSERLSLPAHGESGLGVLRNFAAALGGQAELACPAQQALTAVELANAILWSAVERRPVELPLASDEFASFLGELRGRSKL